MIIYKTRRNYWSCSRPVDWLVSLLKLDPSKVKTQKSWDTVFDDSDSPNRVEVVVDAIQNIVMFPLDVIDSVRVYCANRFATRTHLLDTKLTPGQWHELDDRLLHGMMEAFVDFIEIEKASMQAWSSDTHSPRWKKYIPWARPIRSPELGISHLIWEMTLVDEENNTPSKQALGAQEQWAIYNWWKNIRPLRPEILDITGYMTFRPSDSNADQNKLGQILDNIAQLEKDMEAEDQDMMIRLIKVRQQLWT
jgi:hypothetical protein